MDGWGWISMMSTIFPNSFFPKMPLLCSFLTCSVCVCRDDLTTANERDNVLCFVLLCVLCVLCVSCTCVCVCSYQLHPICPVLSSAHFHIPICIIIIIAKLLEISIYPSTLSLSPSCVLYASIHQLNCTLPYSFLPILSREVHSARPSR